MSTIVTRAGKGTPLTNDEVDSNFTNLNNDKLEVEANDLTTSVTWVNVPNANITEGSVTQHQAALTITESQISDLQSYLTSYTETDPIFSAHASSGITSTQISNWDTAYGWGNHALAGYLTSETSHADVVVDGDFTSNGFMKRTGAGTYTVDTSTYATETYVDTAVSNLVDSAPATLDTLNELASALGDDANFSTTVTTSIGTKWTEDATKITNWDTAYSWGDHSTEGYLTAETNDLSTTVTWANVPDANITESSVTQHQAALSVTESQISDFGTYLTTHQDISGKANLSGALFTGNVTIGLPPTGTQVLTVAGAANLYGGASVTGDITVTGTVDGVDIAARDAVLTSTTTTANSALQNLVEDTTPQLGGNLSAETNDILNAGHISAAQLTIGNGGFSTISDINLNNADITNGGDISLSGTVDGRDVATDGARLDTIPYHRVRDDRISSFNQQLSLTTANVNLGQYQNLYHPSTPVETMRFVDVEWITLWSYISTTNNDIRLSLYLTVPSTVSAVSIGTANGFSPSSYYSVRQSNEAWYWVSGNYEHLFTEFGRISQSSSGSIKQQVLSVQYQSDADRTYFCATNTTAPIVTGDTVYFHPYGWQNVNTQLLVYKDIAERYRSGTERHNVSFKLPYTDDTLIYKLNIKELSSTDSAVVKDARVRITSTGI